MLADEVYVAKLHTKSRDVVLKPLRMGHPKSSISLYTTANALRALVNGRVRWQEAVKRDLVVLAGPGHQQAASERPAEQRFVGTRPEQLKRRSHQPTTAGSEMSA